MKPVLVLYATREGHTHRVAEHLAAVVRAHGLSAETVDSGHIPEGFSLDNYCLAIVSASVHGGKHEPEVAGFVKNHLADLERMPTAFLSVSLSEAKAENVAAPPEVRATAAAEVEKMIEVFLKETGWHPGRIKAVAGALMFTKYNFLMRFVMKRIARNAGADTDTSKDHVYTNWDALAQLVDELARAIPADTAA